MTNILRTAILAAGLSTALGSTALAADVIVPEPVIEDPIVENVRRAFISAKFGYGPAFADNDIEADLSGVVAGLTGVANNGTTVSGQVENDYLIGGSIEAGYFLTDNFRLSVEGTYGYVENELQVIEDANNPLGLPGLIGDDELDGQTFTAQGFLKAAYEVPVAENFLFLRELRVFGTAGVGFVHFNNNLVLEEANNAVFQDARAEGQDTVLAGKVGFGTVSKLTDRIAFTNEFNYLFGEDADLELVTTPATGSQVVPFTLETEAILFQSGIRISF